jgi:hypothetical protein
MSVRESRRSRGQDGIKMGLYWCQLNWKDYIFSLPDRYSVDSNDITVLVSGEQKHYFHLWGLQIFSVTLCTLFLNSRSKNHFSVSAHNTPIQFWSMFCSVLFCCDSFLLYLIVHCAQKGKVSCCVVIALTNCYFCYWCSIYNQATRTATAGLLLLLLYF